MTDQDFKRLKESLCPYARNEGDLKTSDRSCLYTNDNPKPYFCGLVLT